MMKSWSRLCFLILAISSISRAQDKTEDATFLNEKTEGTTAPITPSSNPEVQTYDNSSQPMLTSPTPQNHTSENAMSTTASMGREETMTDGHHHENSASTSLGDSGTTETSASPLVTTTGSMTASTSSKPVQIEAGGSSWGYVILVLIIAAIIILCVILYFLRRASRTYSFDLHRTEPIIQQFSEPTGTFEPVYLDDLDQPGPKDQVTTNDLSPPPVVNGTSLQLEEKVSNGENAPQEQPDANGLEISPTSNTSPSSGDDQADKTSNPPSSTDLFFDAPGEVPQNENNNNPSICSTDPFVEINLDDPEWCDQLLTSAEVTSSVLPFSPFSLSSSSSS